MSNGLGFNKYAARYMAKVVSASGTTPGLLLQQAIESLANACQQYLTIFNVPPIAVYPFYGGNAASHSINLFGEDLIVWQGTVTHNSNGITGNGTTGFGTTTVAPSRRLQSLDRMSFGIYCRTNTAADVAEMGCQGAGYLRIICRTVAGNVAAVYGPGLNAQAALASSAGLTHFAKYSATSNNLYRNGAGSAANATTWSNVPSGNILLLADGVFAASARNVAFAFFSDYNSDPAALYTAVQAFQTELGRQV